MLYQIHVVFISRVSRKSYYWPSEICAILLVRIYLHTGQPQVWMWISPRVLQHHVMKNQPL